MMRHGQRLGGMFLRLPPRTGLAREGFRAGEVGGGGGGGGGLMIASARGGNTSAAAVAEVDVSQELSRESGREWAATTKWNYGNSYYDDDYPANPAIVKYRTTTTTTRAALLHCRSFTTKVPSLNNNNNNNSRVQIFPVFSSTKTAKMSTTPAPPPPPPPTPATPTIPQQQQLPLSPTTTLSGAPLPPLSLVESSKRAAAYIAVDTHFPQPATLPLPTPLIIGIGSGSTVIHVVDRILQLPRALLTNCIFIPTGYQSRQLILSGGLTLGDIDSHTHLDICFDGADEVDPALNLIKGGGACLFQEKLVAIKSAVFVAVADYRKVSASLGTCFAQGVPVEVVPPAVSFVTKGLLALGFVDVRLRMGGTAKAGPVVTDNGNFILDARTGPEGLGSVDHVQRVARGMKELVGVVEHGIFWAGDKKPVVAYFGMEDGTVLKRV